MWHSQSLLEIGLQQMRTRLYPSHTVYIQLTLLAITHSNKTPQGYV